MLVLLVISLSFPRPFRDHYVRHRMVLLFLLCQFCQFVQIRLFLFSQPHRYFCLIITYFLPYYYLSPIFNPCVFYVFIQFLLCTFGTFNHTDIHKKARHEISLMSSKKEICVRRLFLETRYKFFGALARIPNICNLYTFF